ncbi:Protein boule-like isoform 1 [Schistosoma japonicum]|uniref:Protein boule-like isoform 1 n=1 Tax=Schistosoma japonicum TaxID=6182 RepID=A0A4Z2DFS6_SCHJA|nr:Protein boule-like isoform 1 [Schistosoma japonicum]
MSGINIQPSDHVNRLISETALIPFCHSLTAGSSNPPKFGTLIPNRIFVGGIPSNTTEQELKSFFSSFGQVKDVKIINDRVGVSKGSYGFVTFESQEMAEKIIRDESETLVFKDRKLNIGHAIRKQQMFPRPDLTTALFFTGGTIPYTFQNGMAIFPLPSQEYPILAQTATPYATMMLPQLDGGTTLYLPPSLHSTTPVPGSAYTHVSQHAVTAALQQQLHQTGLASALTPAVVGQITALSSSLNNTRHQSQSTTTVIPAAAAAMAAAVQWPQQPVNNNQQTSQQPSTIPATHSISQSSNDQSTNLVTSIAQQQTVAANAAQHPINWRWSPGMQQPQNTFHGTNPQSSICTINTSSNTGVITSLSTISTPNLQFHQQCTTNTTYLCSPSLTGPNHEVMLFHQTSSPFTGNSTSDYSTDHSTHSSGLLESAESLSFQYDGTPICRRTQQYENQLTNIYNNMRMDSSCLSPYSTITPILEFHSHSNCIGQPNSINQISSTHFQHLEHQNHQTNTLISIVNPSQHKIFTGNTYNRHLPTAVYGSPSQIKSAFNELNMLSSSAVSIGQIQSSCSVNSASIQGMTNPIIQSQSSSTGAATAAIALPCVLSSASTSS